MSTIDDATGFAQITTSTHRVSSLLRRYWDAFLEQRQSRRLRAALFSLGDRELTDIGTTRGEIDYVASNRSIDTRGIRAIVHAR
jgi:uncharacterized protein YjiS (DUF1127 family)